MPIAVRALTPVIVLGLLCATTRAHGDPLSKPSDAEARNHLSLGNRLYGIRSFDEAVAEYKAGALIEPAPVFDYNLGQCFRQLGKYKEATWHYERFLNRANPQGELLDAVNNFVTQMKAELDKKTVTQPPTTPAMLPISPAHDVPVPSRGDAWYEDGSGWALSGAGVASVAIGSSLLADAAGITGDANRTTNQQERDGLRDKAHSRNVAGAITGVAGVGLLVAGIVKLAIYPKERSRLASWNLGITGNSVLAFGWF